MDKRLSYLLLLIMLFVAFQSCGVKKRIQKADKHFKLGEYYLAGDLYNSAYKSVPVKDEKLRSQIAFKQAECYRKTNHNRTMQAYQNAIRYKYDDCIVFLYYAQSLQKNRKYEEATKNYEKYLECNPESVVAKNALESLKNISEWRKNPGPYKVQKSKEMNLRRFSSFSPVFLGHDADVLVFTSSRSGDKKKQIKRNRITGMPNNNFYSARKNAKGEWEKPLPLDLEIRKDNAELGVCSFSGDGTKMFFTYAGRSDSLASAVQIMYSNRAGGTWSTPIALKIFKDSTINVAHPAISPDGTTLYFVSDASQGEGGKDLWKAKIENGECKFTENLGPEINTPGDELFPSVRADGVLFFASDGHMGFGGLDIYKATPPRKDKDGNETGWIVENMGAPINSSDDDFGICFSPNAEKGFFSSNREDKRGVDFIWSFELPEYLFAIEGSVLDDREELVPDAIIRMVGTDGTNARIQTKKDGTYRLRMEKDVDYVMMASARGYLNQSYKLSTGNLQESKAFNHNFYLPPVFKPVQLENIYYEFGKWELKQGSEAGLQLLLKLLNDNPNVTIELSAHTDYVGNDRDNKLLSKKRAQVVVDYLIRNGIDAKRLTAIGYGEEKPFVVDAFTAKTYPFLKQGDVLTEDFILKLPVGQQEQSNQINRRTEFRVLSTTYKLY